jgi:hypothetical protein
LIGFFLGLAADVADDFFDALPPERALSLAGSDQPVGAIERPLHRAQRGDLVNVARTPLLVGANGGSGISHSVPPHPRRTTATCIIIRQYAALVNCD